MNGSAANFTDNTGRSYPSPFSVQSAAGSPGFHHTGTFQGLQNMHGNFNVPSMAGTYPLRNSTTNILPSGGMQQSAGNLLTGRFGSNNLPVVLSQISQGSSHGLSGVTNGAGMNVIGSPAYNSSTNTVGGSNPSVLPTSAAIGNRGAVPGLGISPLLGNTGSQITSSMGNAVGSGYIGRSSGGNLSMPGIAPRLNLSSNNNSGKLSLQIPDRLMNGGLQQQASSHGPHLVSMLGNSYASSGGPLSQTHVQAANNLSARAMLNDVNSNDNSPFRANDFPSLTNRPNSAGGIHGHIGSMRKQGFRGPSPQHQEFSIQNEDFPALPGLKGGNADYGMDFHPKDQLRDSSVSMVQTQQFSMGRPSGFTLGGAYPSPRPQQPHQHMPSVIGGGDSFVPVNSQGAQHLHGSVVLPSSNSTYHMQGNGVASYDKHNLQYQQQSLSQFHQRQMATEDSSYRDQGVKSIQAAQAPPDPYGMMHLLSVIKKSESDQMSRALGIDLTKLGLDLNSSEHLHKTFGSPWSNKSAKGDPEFVVPECYYIHENRVPPLNHFHFMKFKTESLFYIFYSMPKDEAQLYAANELYRRGWFYHKEHQGWFSRFPNSELLVKTPMYERGSFLSFDPNTWETKKKDNFLLQYDLIEKRPTLNQH